MRALLQRVESCQLYTNNEFFSEIGFGILTFIGIHGSDTTKDVDYILKKILHLRIFEDTNGKMNFSMVELGLELMIVSQFTLLGDSRKGRRPSFNETAPPEEANKIFNNLVETAKVLYNPRFIKTGKFQTHMKIKPILDGPVSILLDSHRNL